MKGWIGNWNRKYRGWRNVENTRIVRELFEIRKLSTNRDPTYEDSNFEKCTGIRVVRKLFEIQRSLLKVREYELSRNCWNDARAKLTEIER